MEIKSKIALVTGAGHRVGKLIAVALAEAGAEVIIHYHRAEAEARETVAEIKRNHGRATAIRADLSDPQGAIKLVGDAVAQCGGLDILVNSASIFETGAALTLSPEAWQHSLNVNLTAPFFCAQQAALSMQARGGGVIINLADLSGLKPWAKRPAHSVSKAGLLMATKVLAKALAPDIRVNALALGPVLKPAEWAEDEWARAARRTLLQRPGSGMAVADAVKFVIEQDFMTGEVLVLDGGELLT